TGFLRSRIRVDEAMLARVVSNGGILAERYNTRRAIAGKDSARKARGRRRGRDTIGQRRTGRLLENFPVCASDSGCILGKTASADRHDTLAEIHGCLAARVQWMGGNESQRATGVNPDSCDRAPGDGPVPTPKTRGHPNPPK